jgi:hypothetical protein
VVSACLGFLHEPFLLILVLVVFMGEVATGNDLQATEDHGYDVTCLRYKSTMGQSGVNATTKKSWICN